MKIVFLEGLPGVGKSTIAKTIKELKKDNVVVAEEIELFNPKRDNFHQDFYMKNDDFKFNKCIKGIKNNLDTICIVDRSAISTLSYNQSKNIINLKYLVELESIEKWFEKYIEFFSKDYVFVYFLINSDEQIYIPFNDVNDPYGSEFNQKLLQDITIYNCKKYAKNFILKNYKKSQMEDLINEIFN